MTDYSEAMAERARLMSGGRCLTAKVDRYPVGLGGAMDWGISVHDPRLDSNRHVLSTLKMTGPNGEKLVWAPWGELSGAMTIMISQTYFP